ncbi:MAG: hypothetical protein BZ136_06895 [Methanosphaera sp. rholeuAM74]|nr:MAG: hypothetical protein BZ136_06895 [Methanosphaera sp. rholeuAM74]
MVSAVDTNSSSDILDDNTQEATSQKLADNTKCDDKLIENNNVVRLNENLETIDNSYTQSKDSDNDIKQAKKNKTTPEIRLSDYVIHRNETKTFYAMFLDEDVTGTAIFKINGITISDKININNRVVSCDFLVPVTYGVPIHNLTFVYSGDDKYKASRVNSTLTLEYAPDRANPQMKVGNFTTKYNSVVELKATLNPEATGQVAFKVNRKTVAIVTVVNGTASCNYNTSTIMPKLYRVAVVYSGDYRYNDSRANVYLNITKLATTIKTRDISSKAGSTIIFRANVTDEYGMAVNNTAVSFKLNGVSLAWTRTDERGDCNATLVIPYQYDQSKYNITAVSAPNKYVEASTTNATLTLSQLKTTTRFVNLTTKPGKQITLTASVLDENNNPVQRGYITYYINGGKYWTTEISNGYVRHPFTVSATSLSKVNITVEYNGTWKYAKSGTNGHINITMLKTQLTLGNLFTKPGFVSKFTANVTDENNNKVSGGNVQFKINNEVIGLAELKNGTATLNYRIKMYSIGKYTLNATYQGFRTYAASSGINVMNVSPLTTKMSGQAKTVTVGKPVELTVTLTDESRYKVEKGNVTFYVNNKEYANATVKKGTASVTYIGDIALEDKIVKYKAVYHANDIYANTTGIYNLTIVKQRDVYVTNNGNDSNIGTKQAPFKTLKNALNHVAILGTVHLSPGIYYENNITVLRSVRIFGENVKTTIIDGQGKSMIFNASIVNSSVEFNALTIRNGKSTLANTAGAIYAAGTLIASNTIFENNSATNLRSAGAVYNLGIFNATGVTFNNNNLKAATSEGGAIRTIGNTTTLVSCWFNNNTATATSTAGGGAIYLENGALNVLTSSFNGNNISAKQASGGAIKTVNANISMVQTKLTNNLAMSTEYAMGGAIAQISNGTSPNRDLIFYNNTITSNRAYATTAASGGSLYTEYIFAQIADNNFTTNTAYSKSSMGGAVNMYTSFVITQNNRFTKNVANSTVSESLGGAIYHYHNLGTLVMTNDTFDNNLVSSVNSYGGAIYTISKTFNITNLKFTNNTAIATNISIGGAIYTESTTTVNNTDFTSNKVSGKYAGGGALAAMYNLTVTKSNFASNNASNIGNAITGSCTMVNINDNYWGSASPDWTKEIKGIPNPTTYSKTKINH